MSSTPPPPTAKTSGLGAGLLVLASMVLHWPYLSAGFHADDLIFLDVVRRHPLPFSRWQGMWAAEGIGVFDFWWAEPGAQAQFWRPLPSLVFEGSIRLFGETAFPLQLLSILAHGAVAATLFLIALRLSGRTMLAMLAGVLFVACEDHSMTVGWIATMTDLLCVLALHLATLGHLHWLEKRRPLALAASLLFIAVAMGCKETAVIIAPILVLAGWALPEGRVLGPAEIACNALGERTRRLLRDPFAWVPPVAMMIPYLAAYGVLRPARMNNLMYENPLSDPIGYLGHLVVHMPVMWLSTLSPVPPSLTMFLPDTLVPLALVGVIAFGVWLAAMWPWRRDPLAVFALGAYLLALLPQMGADASERLLYYPFTFAAVLLAMPALRVGVIASRFAPDLERPPRSIRWLGWYALGGVLLPGLVLSATMPHSMEESLKRPELETLTAVPAIEQRGADRVIFLNTPGMFSTLYVKPTIRYHLSGPVRARVLSSCNALTTIERVGDRSFVLRVDRPGWLGNMFARVARVTPRITAGAVYEADVFTARIVEVTPDGADALAVRFDLHPGDHSLLIMHWNGERYEPFDLEAMPPDKREVLADTSDVWASVM